MTKKDYVLIAKTILRERLADSLEFAHPLDERARKVSNQATERVVLALANAFRDDNPRFDWDRFVNACGVES